MSRVKLNWTISLIESPLKLRRLCVIQLDIPLILFCFSLISMEWSIKRELLIQIVPVSINLILISDRSIITSLASICTKQYLSNASRSDKFLLWISFNLVTFVLFPFLSYFFVLFFFVSIHLPFFSMDNIDFCHSISLHFICLIFKHNPYLSLKCCCCCFIFFVIISLL